MANFTHIFALPGADHMIDIVNPHNGRSSCYGETLEQLRQRYPGVVEMRYEDFAREKAAGWRSACMRCAWRRQPSTGRPAVTVAPKPPAEAE